MNRTVTTVSEGLDREEMSREDMEPLHGPAFETAEESQATANIEVHTSHEHHGRRHVNLSQEEYNPEEIALMLGTSLEVVMHAIWSGELKTKRRGRDVVSIRRADLTAWLVARGPGV